MPPCSECVAFLRSLNQNRDIWSDIPWLESQLDKKTFENTKTLGSSDICEMDKGIRLRTMKGKQVRGEERGLTRQ